MMGSVGRYARSFGRFWWDFLVGDTPELFVGVLLIVAAALLLRHDRTAAIVVVPILTVVFLLASTIRARVRA